VECVVATGNAGKLREIRALLADQPVELRSLEGLPPVAFPEEGGDYRTNAVAKARAVADQLGVVAVADDSGLEVDALGGAPGPFSARYGGPGLDDRGRLHALLVALEGVPAGQRGARFVCHVALVGPAAEPITSLGTCAGSIRTSPSGGGGFGYDPVFEPEGEAATMAELSSGRKNQISHRARAFAALARAAGWAEPSSA